MMRQKKPTMVGDDAAAGEEEEEERVKMKKKKKRRREPEDPTLLVYVCTTLGTHLLTAVTRLSTVQTVKDIVQRDHNVLFPEVGKVAVENLKFPYQDKHYHLPMAATISDIVAGDHISLLADTVKRSGWTFPVPISMLLKSSTSTEKVAKQLVKSVSATLSAGPVVRQLLNITKQVCSEGDKNDSGQNCSCRTNLESSKEVCISCIGNKGRSIRERGREVGRLDPSACPTQTREGDWLSYLDKRRIPGKLGLRETVSWLDAISADQPPTREKLCKKADHYCGGPTEDARSKGKRFSDHEDWAQQGKWCSLIETKKQECSSTLYTDIKNFAASLIIESRKVIIEELAEQSSNDQNNCPNIIESMKLQRSIANLLMKSLLKRPGDLAMKYRNCGMPSQVLEPAGPGHAGSQQSYTAEERVNEHLLQVYLRLEIISDDMEGPLDEEEKLALINEICEILNNFQFYLPGGVIFGENFLEFCNRHIRSRYANDLHQTLNKIYRKMEFDGFSNSAGVSNFVNEAVHVGASCSLVPEKGEHNKHKSSNLIHSRWRKRSGSQIQKSSSSFLPRIHLFGTKGALSSAMSMEAKIVRAKQIRERAKRLAHFECGARSILKVRSAKSYGWYLKKSSKIDIGLKHTPERIRSDSDSINFVLETPIDTHKIHIHGSSTIPNVKKKLF